jgi:hypothetical protein
MVKKQTIASEIGAALGAMAARAEQSIAGNPTITGFVKKATAKPAAKRTAAAKHSTTTSTKKAVLNAKAEVVEEVLAKIPADVISQEAIAEQAYLYWEARGYQGGDSGSDWTRAEAELKQRAASKSGSSSQ